MKNDQILTTVEKVADEIVGRFQKERNTWPAVVLNSDVATMTAIANDYGYDDVFARLCKVFWVEQNEKPEIIGAVRENIFHNARYAVNLLDCVKYIIKV